MGYQFDLDGIDPEEIGRLMSMLAESDVEECAIERGGFGLSLRRVVRAERAVEPAACGAPPEEEAPEEPLVIRAPAVGVFRRSEKPSATPRVEVGGKVNAGDVVGFIEVMMIPHSVSSSYVGIVDSILVEDGQPVEYGQPLIQLSAIG